MKIKELELSNFRGFEHLKIEFPDNNLAVFIGTNGSGKSSVLDALGMFFSELINQLVDQVLVKDIQQFFNENLPEPADLTVNDIRFNQNSTSNKLKVFSKGACWLWEFSLDNKHTRKKTIPEDYLKTFLPTRSKSIPLLVYYRTNRIILPSSLLPDQKETQNGLEFIQIYSYKNAMNSNLSQFNDFINWFKDTEDAENRIKVKNQDLAYRDYRLEIIRNALQAFLHELTSDTYANLHIETLGISEFSFALVNTDFALVITKNDIEFDIRQLSDGEKTLIMLVCDIARRLAIANPTPNDILNEGEGIVMIDEIELHLHPKWQRNVLPALQKTFPNIQFIVTTHSPHVLNNIEAENVFVLQNEDNKITCTQPDSTLGRDVNWILEEVMEVSPRPTGFDSVWNEVQTLISAGGKDNLKLARQHIDKLIQEFELADDGELNAKLAIIRRKEILKR